MRVNIWASRKAINHVIDKTQSMFKLIVIVNHRKRRILSLNGFQTSIWRFGWTMMTRQAMIDDEISENRIECLSLGFLPSLSSKGFWSLPFYTFDLPFRSNLPWTWLLLWLPTLARMLCSHSCSFFFQFWKVLEACSLRWERLRDVLISNLFFRFEVVTFLCNSIGLNGNQWIFDVLQLWSFLGESSEQ